MDKGVLDTFEGLNLTDRQKKIFCRCNRQKSRLT